MQYFFSTNIIDDKIILSKEESMHCIAVLRHKVGDQIYIVNGRGDEFFCKIISTKNNLVKSTITDQKQVINNKSNSYIHIAIAPTKSNQRLEWFIEKAIEIGVDEISFIRCSNSERKKINFNRINKIAISAIKQSLKACLPIINDIDEFSEVISNISQPHRYIGYLGDYSTEFLGHLAPKNNDYCLFIGPEGDFSEKEIKTALEYNFTSVSLGENRLRTETAGIAGCLILNGINYG